MIKIEKNIPIPDNSLSEYASLEMDVGDSFFVACEEAKRGKTRTRIWNKIRICMTKKELNRNHTIRKVDGGFRVWRLS